MASYYDITVRWLDVCLGRTNKSNFAPGRSNVFAEGDRIYSYGRHFEMARVLRDAKGKARGILLNGDRFSVTTSRHQSTLRSVLTKSDLPRVIIPHSALSAAGIDFDSVEFIEATNDRGIETNHVTYEQPEGSKWLDIEDWDYVDLSAEELSVKVEAQNAMALQGWKDLCGHEERNPGVYTAAVEAGPRVITAEDLGSWVRRERRVVGTHKELRLGNYHTIAVEVLDDGRTKYSWTTYRHLLGESLIRARIPTQRLKDCKDCKGVTEPNLDCETCRGRGKHWVKVSRRAYFLSGFDRNETREVYFLCELARGVHPTTVEEAYETLKPDAVKLAEQMGRTVYRQGDIFAIEMRGLSKRDLRARGATFEKRGNLLRTNHEATEVAYLPDGSTLVRGTLWHNPDFRDPDHRRVTVGKAWHLAVKNTVPVAA